MKGTIWSVFSILVFTLLITVVIQRYFTITEGMITGTGTVSDRSLYESTNPKDDDVMYEQSYLLKLLTDGQTYVNGTQATIAPLIVPEIKTVTTCPLTNHLSAPPLPTAENWIPKWQNITPSGDLYKEDVTAPTVSKPSKSSYCPSSYTLKDQYKEKGNICPTAKDPIPHVPNLDTWPLPPGPYLPVGRASFS